MGGRVGGTQTKFYRETAGLKVTGGQVVKAGTVLTRSGDQWKPGRNVIGLTHLTAGCEGEVYFTRRKGSYKQVQTIIHIKPLSQKKDKKSPVK